MKLLPPGFRIGHYTDVQNATGCTVVLCPEKTVAGCDVRGNSPGSRELALLGSTKKMNEVHAILLTGGSAFGLAAADGVMRFLESKNRGYVTPWGRVPIVPAAVIFDLNVGSWSVRPTSEDGYAACQAASTDVIVIGSVGAGTGATVGKWGGMESRMKGGIGLASWTKGDLTVSALAVVNAVGDVVDEKMDVIAGARSASGRWKAADDPLRSFARTAQVDQTNTTLVVIMTDAKLSKIEATLVSERAHDGMARAIRPCHTSFDGDIAFALSSGETEAPMDSIAELGALLVADAIRSAVRSASSVAGIPALGAS